MPLLLPSLSRPRDRSASFGATCALSLGTTRVQLPHVQRMVCAVRRAATRNHTRSSLLPPSKTRETRFDIVFDSLQLDGGTKAAPREPMQARETMTRRVFVAPPELSLADGWAILERHRIRHLPIVSSGVLLGIVSDRDLLLHATPDERGLAFGDLRLGEAMTPAPITCGPSTPITELVRAMTERKIDAVPVVDDLDRLVGLVTSTDLLLLLLEREEARDPIPFRFELVSAQLAA